jgi:hypothetical protein
VVSQVDANVSEEHALSIFNAEATKVGNEGSTSQLCQFSPDNGNSMYLRNGGIVKRHDGNAQDNTNITPTAVRTSNLIQSLDGLMGVHCSHLAQAGSCEHGN